MTIANILLTIVVLVAAGTAIFYYIKKKKEAPTENTINIDDKTYTLEKMQEFVKRRLDEITKVNLYDIGLSEEELKRRKNKKYELKKALKGYKGGIYCIDARKVSEEALGRYFPNTPMLAAIVKVSGIMSDEAFLEDMKGSFKHKFAKKPEVIEGNMKALELALKEVTKIQ